MIFFRSVKETPKLNLNVVLEDVSPVQTEMEKVTSVTSIASVKNSQLFQ